jgi:peptide/nickel transport system substrate-binding protein
MNRFLKLVAAVALAGMVAAACGGGNKATTSGTPSASGSEIPTGGVLKMALEADVDKAFDPAKEYSTLSWEPFRCCLLRMLLGTNGEDANHEGDVLRPDLATDLPQLSADGLTYTFTIKPGVHYAPPFDNVEVTAADFARAIARESDSQAAAGGYSFYYSPSGGTGGGIVGFDEAKGSVPSGVEVVDDHTLSITLTAPVGDFPWRMTMPAMAPIPPSGDKVLGWADGHTKDYGRYLVGTGPYMFKGTDALDPNGPPTQDPISGYIPGRSWTLVRNPSYDPATDGLRPAYVDEIDVAIGGTAQVLANEVDNGTIDLEFGGVPPAQQIQAYQADPNRADQVYSASADGIRYLAMNIAVPPFDDIHVRKAMNYVIDKDALRRTRGGELFGQITGHFIPSSLMGGANADYDPYASPNGQGDVTKAKAEMALSKYDANGDGICDAPECQGVLTITDSADPYPAQNALLVADAKKIGIELDVKTGDRYTFMYDKCLDPSSHAAFCPSVGWWKDYPDALTFGPPTLGSAAIGPDGCCNYSLVGAAADLLKANGYSVTDVPTLDTAFDKCTVLPIGPERLQCWAEADKAIMEQAVPVIPWLLPSDVYLVGDRLLNFTYDQSAGMMSLDHVALVGGGA